MSDSPNIYSKYYSRKEKAQKYYLTRSDLIGYLTVEKETKILLSLIGKTSINTLVEIGVGGGVISAKLLNKLSPDLLIGIDTSIHMLHIAKKNLYSHKKNPLKTSVNLIRASIYYLPLKESIVDLFITIRLLSHLPQKKLVFRELKKALRNTGTVMFDYYNRNSVLSLSKLLSGSYGDSTDISTLRLESKAADFEIIKVKSGFSIGHVIFDRIPKKIIPFFFLVDSLLSRSFILRSFSARRFVLMKKNGKSVNR